MNASPTPLHVCFSVRRDQATQQEAVSRPAEREPHYHVRVQGQATERHRALALSAKQTKSQSAAGWSVSFK